MVFNVHGKQKAYSVGMGEGGGGYLPCQPCQVSMKIIQYFSLGDRPFFVWLLLSSKTGSAMGPVGRTGPHSLLSSKTGSAMGPVGRLGPHSFLSSKTGSVMGPVGRLGPHSLLSSKTGSAMGPVGRTGPHSRTAATAKMRL